MDMQITKTEIQGIEAKTLLDYFQNLADGLTQLQKTVEPKPDTQLLTRKEVAEWLGVSLPTLHAWTKNGILQAYRIGNKVRYKRAEVVQSLTAIESKR